MEKVVRMRVSATNCDLNARLSTYGIFCIVQDVVSEYLGVLGHDNVTMRNKYNGMWVFTKNKVEIYSRPEWGVEFTVRNYVFSKSSIVLSVMTEFLDEKGNIFAISRLEVCALNFETRRIMRLSDFGMGNVEIVGSKNKIDFGRPREVSDICKTVKIESDNIDFSLHTNNVQYVRFILNTYNVDRLKSSEICGFEVHFVNETREGEVLEICKENEGKNDIFTIRESGRVVTKAIVKFA